MIFLNRPIFMNFFTFDQRSFYVVKRHFFMARDADVSEASTRHRLEALETTAATCGPKERALSMVTSRNFGCCRCCQSRRCVCSPRYVPTLERQLRTVYNH